MSNPLTNKFLVISRVIFNATITWGGLCRNKNTKPATIYWLRASCFFPAFDLILLLDDDLKEHFHVGLSCI